MPRYRARSGSSTVSVPCIMWVKVRSTSAYDSEDTIYPTHVEEGDLEQFPKYVQECYEECSGQVRIWVAWDDGCADYPPSYETEVNECDECNFDNWSTKQEAKLLKKAQSY